MLMDDSVCNMIELEEQTEVSPSSSSETDSYIFTDDNSLQLEDATITTEAITPSSSDKDVPGNVDAGKNSATSIQNKE
eukprot:gene1992-2262_t